MSGQRQLPGGRRQHTSMRGSRSRSWWTSGAGIAGTAVVAVLAVAVVVLAFRHRGGSEVSRGDLTALQAQVDSVDGRVAALQRALEALARKPTGEPKVPAATKQIAARQALAERCLTQLQAQIDDIIAYLSYGPAPTRTRVTGACVSLLEPHGR